MERIGSKVIRRFMPDQHREFFQQLPFLVVGSVDLQGWPWASLLPGRPGFIQSSTEKSLEVGTSVIVGDPLENNIAQGSAIALLGIEMSTRRRNRANAHITHATASSFSVEVDQSFGNCPQYIQARDIEFIREPGEKTEQQKSEALNELDAAARKLICDADTFFVSSYVASDKRPETAGVDVSHRGGRRGFVKVVGNTLTVPDFSGNNYFNTLGNFLVNPRAGLVFPDFETGELLTLTGSVEILWEDHPEVQAFDGAERAWRFQLEHGFRLTDALPFRASFNEYSPKSLTTGGWVK